jgi:hypothetical protein
MVVAKELRGAVAIALPRSNSASMYAAYEKAVLAPTGACAA